MGVGGVMSLWELITPNNRQQINSSLGRTGEISHWSDTKSISKISLALYEGREGGSGI